MKTLKCDQPQSLMIETIKLLKQVNLLIVYKETDIPYHWLTKFSTNVILNPSVNRVQYLNAYLKGKLNVAK